MPVPYLCPACGTNRSRFNLIEQVVQPVKKDAKTGEIIENVAPNDPLQYPYRAEKYRVQCGVCGVIEPEERFIQRAIHNRLT
jgi:rubredoxin